MVAGYDMDALRLAIKTFADTQSGITFVWEDQKGPRPARPYGTLKILTDRVLSRGNIIDEDSATPGAELDRTITNQGVMSVSFQTYADPVGVAAWDFLQLVRDALSHPALYSTLSAAGIGVRQTPDITNVSDAVGAHPRARAAFTVDFNVASNIATTETIIETVEATAEIKDVDGTIVDSRTVTAPGA